MAAEQRKLLEQLMGGKFLPNHDTTAMRRWMANLLTVFPSLIFLADQLMGTGAASRSAQLSITDPKVCRSYLVGTCPHDHFTNTKQDLGPCPKIHSEGLKAEYEAASPSEKVKWGFDYDYTRDLQKHIDECDRRIEAAQRRLEKTPDEIRQTNNLVSVTQRGIKKVDMLVALLLNKRYLFLLKKFAIVDLFITFS
jgi:LUC7 N_terminus